METLANVKNLRTIRKRVSFNLKIAVANKLNLLGSLGQSSAESPGEGGCGPAFCLPKLQSPTEGKQQPQQVLSVAQVNHKYIKRDFKRPCYQSDS